MTIDQLAPQARDCHSTLRLYQNRGLLPPPRRQGRMGYYNTEHRDRFRPIAHLQERGFSLAAIKETLDHWTEGRSLAHLLGVSQFAPSLERKSVSLSPEEFAGRFAWVDITQGDIQRAVWIGLVELDGAELSIPNEAFIDLGADAARLGIPVSEVLDEHEALMISVHGHRRAIPRGLPTPLLGTVRQQGHARPGDAVPDGGYQPTHRTGHQCRNRRTARTFRSLRRAVPRPGCRVGR